MFETNLKYRDIYSNATHAQIPHTIDCSIIIMMRASEDILHIYGMPPSDCFSGSSTATVIMYYHSTTYDVNLQNLDRTRVNVSKLLIRNERHTVLPNYHEKLISQQS